mgnify:FL=1
MKLIGVRFSRYNLTFSRSFLYVLILNHLFKNIKKFANFLDNFLKRKERGIVNANVKVSYSLICKDLNEAIDAKNKIIANTLDDETVEIKIECLRDV